jgi:hypothetical protein
MSCGLQTMKSDGVFGLRPLFKMGISRVLRLVFSRLHINDFDRESRYIFQNFHIPLLFHVKLIQKTHHEKSGHIFVS